MKIVSLRLPYYCALLEPEDFRKYRVAHEYLWGHDYEDDEWEKRWTDPHNRTFLLYKRQAAPRDRIVGVANLDLSRRFPVLNSGAIADDLQGKRLIDILYAARLRYAADETDAEAVRLDIEPGNDVSAHVAERNGFTCISRGFYAAAAADYEVFQRDLDDIRAMPSHALNLDLLLARS